MKNHAPDDLLLDELLSKRKRLLPEGKVDSGKKKVAAGKKSRCRMNSALPDEFCTAG
jgi:hypothetical protein